MVQVELDFLSDNLSSSRVFEMAIIGRPKYIVC